LSKILKLRPQGSREEGTACSRWTAIHAVRVDVSTLAFINPRSRCHRNSPGVGAKHTAHYRVSPRYCCQFLVCPRANAHPLAANNSSCDNLFMTIVVTTNKTELPAKRSLLHVTGVVTWCCRHCDRWNRKRVSGSSWKVQCSNRLCKRWALLSAIQEDVPVGRGAFWRSMRDRRRVT